MKSNLFFQNLNNSMHFSKNNNNFFIFSSDSKQTSFIEDYNLCINIENSSIHDLFPIALECFKKIGTFNSKKMHEMDKIHGDSFFFYLIKQLYQIGDKQRKKNLNEMLDKFEPNKKNPSEQIEILRDKIDSIGSIQILEKIFIFIIELIDFIFTRDSVYELLEQTIAKKYLEFFGKNKWILKSLFIDNRLNEKYTLDLNAKTTINLKRIILFSMTTHQLIRKNIVKSENEKNDLENFIINNEIRDLLNSSFNSQAIKQRIFSL